jgi:hypothetical protein
MPWQGLIYKRVVEGVRTPICTTEGDGKRNLGSRKDGVIHTSGRFVVIRKACAAFGGS